MKPLIIATFGTDEYIRAMRRASRKEEIERHGRQLELGSRLHPSKKAYSRKQKHHLAYANVDFDC